MIGLSVMLVLSLLAGCKSSSQSTDSEGEKAESADVSSQADQSSTEESTDDFSFEDVSDVEFTFCSGAGGWATILTIHEDGTFEGEYHDSEMGSTGDGYPNGTVILSDFTGEFTEPEKVNDYTYSVQIKNIEYEKDCGTEEIKDETLYSYEEAYGLADAEDILIYLPGAPIDQLPDAFIGWAYPGGDATESTLSFYGLYNEAMEEGFSSAEATTSEIDEELADIASQSDALEQRMETEDLTQTELNEISAQNYQLWDDELNSIWSRLKETLDDSTMEELTSGERKWISNRDEEMQAAGADYEGGSMQQMVESDKGAELTKERVYELAEYLN